MLIPSLTRIGDICFTSLSRRVNANSQRKGWRFVEVTKLIKKGEC